MEHTQAGPAITQLLSSELRFNLLRLLLPNAKQLPDVLPRPQILETILRERPAGWVENNNWDQWLLSELSRALDVGRQKLAEKMTDIPQDFSEALQAGGLADFFAGCTVPHRREYLQWISGAKQPATRSKRIQQAVKMLAGKCAAETARARKKA